MNKSMTLMIVGIAVIMSIIFSISFSNTGRFLIKSTDGAVEVWRGKFAPIGEEHFITMPGAIPPEILKEEYSKKDIYPLVCNYYIDKSDTLLNVSGLPDFENIRTDLNKAMSFATTDKQEKEVNSRLVSIDLMVLLYKADVAAGSGNIPGLKAAKKYLKKAKSLDLDKDQKALVGEKIAEVQALINPPKKKVPEKQTVKKPKNKKQDKPRVEKSKKTKKKKSEEVAPKVEKKSHH